MESGASVTIADALKYLDLNVKIPTLEVEKDPEDEDQVEKPTDAADDDPALPQSLCQVCLEAIQSSYEFKFRYVVVYHKFFFIRFFIDVQV